MSTYKVRILKAATIELEKIDTATARRIIKRIYWLSENLQSLRPTALKGDLSGLFKLREGDYRIFYQILHKEKTIIVHAIGHRREIYK
ncbi:MAG: type II toxin-antitoxin system RelE/ParE family toxin [Bacteroidota bacterium]